MRPTLVAADDRLRQYPWQGVRLRNGRSITGPCAGPWPPESVRISRKACMVTTVRRSVLDPSSIRHRSAARNQPIDGTAYVCNREADQLTASAHASATPPDESSEECGVPS